MSGVDAGVAGRIDRLIADADYRDSASAMDDAARVAVLSTVDGAERAREDARLAAVRAMNQKRAPGARAARGAGTFHRVMFVAALIVGAGAVGLVALSPRSGRAALSLQDGTLVAGALAVVAMGLLWWLEPYYARGELFGTGTASPLYLLYAVVWIGFAASVPVFRWQEVDDNEPIAVIVGLALFVAAGVGLIVLWRRSRRSAASGSRTGVDRLTRGLIDERDAPAVVEALDRWWADAGPAATRRDRDGLLEARRAVLARLRDAGLIDVRDERRASARPFGEWKERRR